MSSTSSIGSDPSVRKRACNRFREEQKRLAAEKYREAVELYASTALTVQEISRRTGVSAPGLSAYIRRYRRDLLLKRHGVDAAESSPAGKGIRLRSNGPGQSLPAHAKYRDAVAACLDEAHIGLSVSEIAREFGLSATGLGNQLRAHYPEVSRLRERERARRGMGDNLPRGPRSYSMEQYSSAVDLLRARDVTVPEAARLCGVSLGGLRQHLSFYHKDVLSERAERRKERKRPVRGVEGAAPGTSVPSYGTPSAATEARYRDALDLYRTTRLPLQAIAERTGVNVNSFRGYLRRWHPDARRPEA